MKLITFLLMLLSVCGAGFCQANGTIRINSIDNNSDILAKTANLYPQFNDGQVVFTNGSITAARLNYNVLTSQVLFLTPSGDTLMLGKPENISYVSVNSDTFYHYSNNTFVLKLTHSVAKPNLYVQHKIKYLGTEKKGAYGTFSEVTAVNSTITVSDRKQRTQYIGVDENSVYKNNSLYFISLDGISLLGMQ